MATAGQPTTLLRVLRPDVQPRLYQFYDELRAADACYWDRTLKAWVATSHEIVSRAAGDPRLSSVRYPDLAAVPEELQPVARVLDRQMLYSDAPDHPRLRGLVSKAFTPRAVEQLRQQVAATVDQLIANPLRHGRMDVVADLAYPLPASVICDLLDVPAADRDRLRSWSGQVANVVGSLGLTPEQNRAAAEGVEELLGYFRWLAAHQGTHSPDGLLQAFASAKADGAGLSEDELLANVVLLLSAGHETTTHFIGNAMLALLQHPQRLRELAHRLDLVPAAVEELLRYDAPVQILLRRARQDFDLAGRSIAAGQAVLLVNGAANRDPAAFPDPHVLDFTRSGARHIAFGHGPHFCLGAGLARLEGEIAIRSLITHLPGLRLAGQTLEWNSSITFRGLTRLDVVFTPLV